MLNSLINSEINSELLRTVENRFWFPMDWLNTSGIYVTGGLLRDVIAGKTPTGDIDFIGEESCIKRSDISKCLNMNSFVWNYFKQDKSESICKEYAPFANVNVMVVKDGRLTDHINTYTERCNGLLYSHAAGIIEMISGAIKDCQNNLCLIDAKNWDCNTASNVKLAKRLIKFITNRWTIEFGSWTRKE